MELIGHYELLQEAYNEAIEFSLLDLDGYGLAFLQHWTEGDWHTIAEEWKDFNINSEAQQYLIKESGGM